MNYPHRRISYANERRWLSIGDDLIQMIFALDFDYSAFMNSKMMPER